MAKLALGIEIYMLLLESDYNLIILLFHLMPEMHSERGRQKPINFFLELNYSFGVSSIRKGKMHIYNISMFFTPYFHTARK